MASQPFLGLLSSNINLWPRSHSRARAWSQVLLGHIFIFYAGFLSIHPEVCSGFSATCPPQSQNCSLSLLVIFFFIFVPWIYAPLFLFILPIIKAPYCTEYAVTITSFSPRTDLAFYCCFKVMLLDAGVLWHTFPMRGEDSHQSNFIFSMQDCKHQRNIQNKPLSSVKLSSWGFINMLFRLWLLSSWSCKEILRGIIFKTNGDMPAKVVYIYSHLSQIVF